MNRLRLKFRAFCREIYFRLRPAKMYRRRDWDAKVIENTGFVLPYIEMRITTRCNMRCKNCDHLIPKYGSAAKDLPFDKFKTEFDNLMNAVSFINVFSLVGGETMLSNHFIQILQYVMACEKVGEIRFITNGKTLPSDRLLSLLSGSRVWLHFSLYPQNKDNYPQIKALCDKHNVKWLCYDNENGRQEWYDYGVVKRYRHTRHGLKYISSKCYFGGAKQYCNGMLYLCPRISNAHELGLLELPAAEQLRITDNVEESRRNILKFCSLPFSHGCRYCNATHARKIPPAEQID